MDGKIECMVDIAQMKDVRGAHKTESLFIETISPASAESYTAIFSLRDYDNKGYPSAYNIYMECADEREAALRLVGSMIHWRKLCQLNWFMNGRDMTGFEGLHQWREDMSARDVSIAKVALLERCEDGEVSAARALYDMTVKEENKKTKAMKKESKGKGKSVDIGLDSIINTVVNLKSKG